MPKRSSKKKSRILATEKNSMFTKLGYFLGIIAIIYLSVIGALYNSTAFGQSCLFVAVLGILAIFLVDPINNKPVFLKQFRELSVKTPTYAMIIFLGLFVLQITFSSQPTGFYLFEALAIIFSGVVEELFFRGVIMSIFFRVEGENISKHIKISHVGILGIIISSFIFAVFHLYTEFYAFLMVFLGGLWLGFFFWLWRDITANMFGHMTISMFYIIWGIL